MDYETLPPPRGVDSRIWRSADAALRLAAQLYADAVSVPGCDETLTFGYRAGEAWDSRRRSGVR